MIGNENDALLAFKDWHAGHFDHLYSDLGTTRYVFLIDDVIYKVDNGYGYNANENEWDKYNEIDRDSLPANIRIPEMSLYRFGKSTVLAVEKVTGQMMGECLDRIIGMPCCEPEICLDDNLAEIMRLITDDLAYGNVIRDNDTYYMVDIA